MDHKDTTDRPEYELTLLLMRDARERWLEFAHEIKVCTTQAAGSAKAPKVRAPEADLFAGLAPQQPRDKPLGKPPDLAAWMLTVSKSAVERIDQSLSQCAHDLTEAWSYQCLRFKEVRTTWESSTLAKHEEIGRSLVCLDATLFRLGWAAAPTSDSNRLAVLEVVTRLAVAEQVFRDAYRYTWQWGHYETRSLHQHQAALPDTDAPIETGECFLTTEFVHAFQTTEQLIALCSIEVTNITKEMHGYCATDLLQMRRRVSQTLVEIESLYRRTECYIDLLEERPWIDQEFLAGYRRQLMAGSVSLTYAASAVRRVEVVQRTDFVVLREAFAEIRAGIALFEEDHECWSRCRTRTTEAAVVLRRIVGYVATAETLLKQNVAYWQEKTVQIDIATRSGARRHPGNREVYCEIAEQIVVELRQLECITDHWDGFVTQSLVRMFRGVHQMQLICVEVDVEPPSKYVPLFAETRVEPGKQGAGSAQILSFTGEHTGYAPVHVGPLDAPTLAAYPMAQDVFAPACDPRIHTLADALEKSVIPSIPTERSFSADVKSFRNLASALRARRTALGAKEYQRLQIRLFTQWRSAKLRLKSIAARTPELQRHKIRADLAAMEAAEPEVTQALGLTKSHSIAQEGRYR